MLELHSLHELSGQRGRPQTGPGATAALSSGGLSEVARGFTKNCRGCGHKMSLHSSPAPAQQYAAPPAPVPPRIPPGWYADPIGQPCNRWWDGYTWTAATAPRP